MTDKQFSEIQESLKNLKATLLAGFGALAGLQDADSKMRQWGRDLTTEEWMSAVHGGLDIVMLLMDNAVQILSDPDNDS